MLTIDANPSPLDALKMEESVHVRRFHLELFTLLVSGRNVMQEMLLSSLLLPAHES